MLHNGIEHGMMGAQSEAWQMMSLCLGMTYDEIGDEFARWNADGELVRKYNHPVIACATSLTIIIERNILDRYRGSDQQAA